MVSAFAQRVYDKLLLVPEGGVTTYKELAKAVGTRSCRAVGRVMRTNPYAPFIPCHRVVASDGSIGGFGGGWQRGGKVDEKVSLLAQEGVLVVGGKVADFEARMFVFSR